MAHCLEIIKGLGLLHPSFYSHSSGYSKRGRARKGQEMHVHKCILHSVDLQDVLLKISCLN